ncbi:MAG: hypothetical protein ACN6NI_08305 [Acinetobacter sp.]
MMQFYKTQRGIEVLQDRSVPLTARQRRLLVLIGSKDFDLLNDGLKQQLAPAELLEQLCELNLIAQADTKIDLANSEIRRPLNASLATPSITQDLSLSAPIAEPQENSSAETPPEHQFTNRSERQALSFEDLKYLMMDTLQKYCGLMARQQIQHILQVQDLRSLKLCQMQWITSLQESRLAPQDLNHILQQINFALAQLQQNEAHE